MMVWLSEHGYDCTVLTSYPYYPQWEIQPPYIHKSYRYTVEMHGKIKVYRCPLYVPAKPSGSRRMLMEMTFSTSALVRILRFLVKEKFDTVITVVPPFHLGMLALMYRKIFKSKVIYHIQDLQIEAAKELKMIKNEHLLKLLFKIEKYILRRADVVSSISSAMIERIELKSLRKVLFFPNWADTNVIFPLHNQDDLKAEFGFAATDKIILYSGAIGEKQGLSIVLDAALALKDNTAVKFIICGSGPYKIILQDTASQLGLENVFFFPLQPVEKMNHFLNMAYLHLVIQKADASDLVMPSKLANILAVGGLVLVTANEDSVLHTDINAHNMGLLVPAENKDALIAGIEKAIHTDCTCLKENARKYAENFLSIDKVLQTFVKDAVE